MSPTLSRESQQAKRITLKRGRETRTVVISNENLRDLGTPVLVGKDVKIDGKPWSVWDVQDVSILARIQIAQRPAPTPKASPPNPPNTTPNPRKASLNGEGRLRSRQMVALSGASTRQIQWWHEHKIVIAHHEGHANYYDRIDALKILVIASLRRKHVCLKIIRAAVRQISAEFLEPQQDTFLVLSGGRPLFVQGASTVLRAAQSSKDGIQLLSISELVEKVNAAYQGALL